MIDRPSLLTTHLGPALPLQVEAQGDHSQDSTSLNFRELRNENEPT